MRTKAFSDCHEVTLNADEVRSAIVAWLTLHHVEVSVDVPLYVNGEDITMARVTAVIPRKP